MPPQNTFRRRPPWQPWPAQRCLPARGRFPKGRSLQRLQRGWTLRPMQQRSRALPPRMTPPGPQVGAWHGMARHGTVLNHLLCAAWVLSCACTRRLTRARPHYLRVLGGSTGTYEGGPQAQLPIAALDLPGLVVGGPGAGPDAAGAAGVGGAAGPGGAGAGAAGAQGAAEGGAGAAGAGAGDGLIKPPMDAAAAVNLLALSTVPSQDGTQVRWVGGVRWLPAFLPACGPAWEPAHGMPSAVTRTAGSKAGLLHCVPRAPRRAPCSKHSFP